MSAMVQMVGDADAAPEVEALTEDDFGRVLGRGDAGAADTMRRHRGTGAFPRHEPSGQPRSGSGQSPTRPAAGRRDGPFGVRSQVPDAGAPGVPGCDAVYLPPGWPEQVRAPETLDWEQSAVAFLLDCCPADYRAHLVLRRHPVVLASLAGQFVESQIRAGREAIAGTRAGLGDYVGNDVLDATIEVLHAEQARLVRVRRAVALVEEALRGRVFIRRL